MKLGNIVAALREATGWGTPEVARRATACGHKRVSYQQIQQLEEKPDRSPSYLPQLAAAFGKTVEELLAWRPGMPAEGPNSGSTLTVTSRENRSGYLRLPLLEGYAGMGRGDYVGDYPEVVDYLDVTREWAAQALRGVPADALRVITGRGSSMRGVFEDGDLVFLDARVKEFVGDSAYCFRWNGLVYIKRLQMIGKGRVRILSANPDYAPVDASLQELEIGGRALAAWTLREF